MIEWPHGVFPIQVASYSVKSAGSFFSYADYGGAPRQIETRSSDTIEASIQVQVHECDSRAWVDFYFIGINGGSDAFLMLLDVGGGLQWLEAVIKPASLTQTATVFGFSLAFTVMARISNEGSGVEDAVLPSELITSLPYSFSYGSSNITDIENSGIPLVSRDLKYESVPFNIRFENINRTKLAAWEYFYRNAIGRGGYSFYMPLDSGFGVEDHAVTIADSSINVRTTNGISWTVEFTAIAERLPSSDSEYCGKLWELANCAGSGQLELVIRGLDTLVNDCFSRALNIDYYDCQCGFIMIGIEQQLFTLTNEEMPKTIAERDYI